MRFTRARLAAAAGIAVIGMAATACSDGTDPGGAGQGNHTAGRR